MARPGDLRYAETHEWVRIEGNEAVIGITDFAVEQLSDLAFVDLPRVGTVVQQKGRFGEIESTKAASELFSPVSGEVVAVHEGLADHLEQISESPFGEGWMIRVRLCDPSELDNLLSAAEYETHLQSQEH